MYGDVRCYLIYFTGVTVKVDGEKLRQEFERFSGAESTLFEGLRKEDESGTRRKEKDECESNDQFGAWSCNERLDSMHGFLAGEMRDRAGLCGLCGAQVRRILFVAIWLCLAQGP